METLHHKPRIAVISPEKAPYSATFIKAHIDLLHAHVTHLFGIFFPTDSADGKYALQEKEYIRKFFHKFRLFRTYKGIFKDLPLAQYLEQEKIQLVLAEFGPVGAEVLSACKLLNLPLIVHFHGYDAYAYNLLSHYKKLYQEMFDYASYLIVVSQDMRKQLLHLGAPAHKLVLNPCGPNEAFFEVTPTFETKNFIAVGRFVEKKGPHLTLAAFKQVLEKIPEARLLMAGDGPLLKECQQLATQWRIQNSVAFIGAKSHQEIVELYTKAYCFVQHSVVASNGDSEGTPVAVLEASAASLPVVATRHAGIKDVIIEGETGYLVDERDVEGMAACMIQLAQNKEKAITMGKVGRQRVKENYTMEMHINTINQLIKLSVNY